MYKNRAVFNGETAEIFGAQTLPLDKFARTIGFKRLAVKAWDQLPPESKALFEAYCAGVNDFVQSVSLSSDSAKAFPPEIYIFGLHRNIKPWLPTDSLGMGLVMHLGLTWDWVADLTREFNKVNSEELEELADQFSPFAEYYLHNVVTILREDDIINTDKWTSKTLSERYVQNLDYLKAAEPKRSRDVV